MKRIVLKLNYEKLTFSQNLVQDFKLLRNPNFGVSIEKITCQFLSYCPFRILIFIAYQLQWTNVTLIR